MSNSSFDPQNQNAEIELTALLYLSNELSEAEVHQFEELLAKSQPAREILANSIEMIQATYACQDSPQLSTTLRSNRSEHQYDSLKSKLGWISVGVAACLVGVFSIGSFFPQTTPINPVVTTVSQNSVETDQLAELWINFTQNQDGLAYADRDPILDLNTDLELIDEIAFEDESMEFDTDNLQSTLAPPAWMFAAFTSIEESSDIDMEMGETTEEMIP
ncbi:MAG: hypothetical protein COA78_31055 [Blastopirellula sp.]|nr:MAG: hypothetical protein COA78_31055 [Blastopirellula sp.]